MVLKESGRPLIKRSQVQFPPCYRLAPALGIRSLCERVFMGEWDSDVKALWAFSGGSEAHALLICHNNRNP